MESYVERWTREQKEKKAAVEKKAQKKAQREQNKKQKAQKGENEEVTQDGTDERGEGH